jgi:hypothetical protein
MMPILHLSMDELLTTTRSVRKCLDLTRPVEAEVIHARQSERLPTRSPMSRWQRSSSRQEVIRRLLN